MENVLNILQPALIILLAISIFVIRYNLGYPFNFNMCVIGISKYAPFYKNGIGFKAKIASGYVIQKIKTKEFNNINFKLNTDIEKGDIHIYLFDKDKNVICRFHNENSEKPLKVNSNEAYYLKIIYTKMKGEFDLSYKLS